MRKRLLLIFSISIFISCGTNSFLKKTRETRKLLVGKWRYENPKIFNEEYYFYEDSTWKYISKNYKKETFITKGKYYIGTQNKVFMRCFGSQHWPENSDTINDYKTSINVKVMFLRNDILLINNQEDYSQKYIKVK